MSAHDRYLARIPAANLAAIEARFEQILEKGRKIGGGKPANNHTPELKRAVALAMLDAADKTLDWSGNFHRKHAQTEIAVRVSLLVGQVRHLMPQLPAGEEITALTDALDDESCALFMGCLKKMKTPGAADDAVTQLAERRHPQNTKLWGTAIRHDTTPEQKPARKGLGS